MSILNTQTRVRFWPLKGDQGEAPAWAEDSMIDFNLSNIPKLTSGNKANYVAGLMLTAWGQYTTDGGQDDVTKITWEDLCLALYGSFDLQGAWHGRPLAAQHVRGATARFWETISTGYQSASRHQVGGRASTVAAPFRHTLFLPLSHALGKNGARYTSQLSICYKDSHLEINTPSSPAIIPKPGTSEGDVTLTLGTVHIRCTAVLLPEASLRIAPGIEWLELQTKGASTGSDPVDLESLGNATALEGVEPGAGIDTMLALCDIDDLDGSFNLASLTQFSAPFIDQTQTKHLDPFVHMLEEVTSKGQRPRDQVVIDVDGAGAVIGFVVDSSGFPNDQDTSSAQNNGAAGTTLNAKGLCFPIIVSGPEMELTKLPRFEGTVTYYRTIIASNTIDRTLIHQFKSWTPAKHEDFRQMIISEGLAAAVLGTKNIVPKGVRNEMGAPMDPSAARFFPVEWVAAAEPEKKAA